MSSLEERRRRHAAYKRHVERHGKPFFPHAMFHDTVMSAVVVAVIIGLAVIWHETANGTEAGILGPLYAEKADPATTSFIPRPDWYFYFLFYLLRIFKWPDSVVLATVGIPTIAMILLFVLPFVDLRPERRLARRPVAVVAAILVVISMGVLTWRGATAKESLGSEALLRVPDWIKENKLPPPARPGAELFAQAGCQNCHTYLGSGTSALGAPDLSRIGARNRGVDYFARYVGDPRQFGNNVMPQYSQTFTAEELRQIAVFLDASRGPQP